MFHIQQLNQPIILENWEKKIPDTLSFKQNLNLWAPLLSVFCKIHVAKTLILF